MDVELIATDEVESFVLASLDIERPTLATFSPEVMAAALRRAASFMCPSPPRQIVQAVYEAMKGLPGFRKDCLDELKELLEALISYGDLVLVPMSLDGSTGWQVFLSFPRFVRRESGAFILVGIKPDAVPILRNGLEARISYRRHVRTLNVEGLTEVEELLAASGLQELGRENWLKHPRIVSSRELLSSYEIRLKAARSSGEIDGLRILDSTLSVNYYRGRWRGLANSDVGMFVARRPQAFGADLWCLVEVENGVSLRLIDLPLAGGLITGADEAWRIQAALDSERGVPQLVIVQSKESYPALSFLSPLPSWAQRHLDIFGSPIPRVPGALFSYALPGDEIAEELAFLNSTMWLAAHDQR